ncbi:MAG: VWA domain-containing protein [Treponema sp.]|nr:VWA domain-containing protein [Treponema sp.]
MNFAFDRPYLLVIIPLLIPCLFILLRFLKPLFTLAAPLGPPGGIYFKAPPRSGLPGKLFFVMEVIAVSLLLVAAAGPHFSYTETIWLNRGADIIFVMDISPSMAALDMNGRSRFETARDLIRDFAVRRPSDSLGLAAVGEEAVLLVPLTTDRESFFTRLDSLFIGELGDGTALGMGLGIAAFHINKSNAPRKAVVLITDGENNAGAVHPETTAALLGEMGISFWVIGVGSSGEVPVNYLDPVTKMRRTGTFESHYDEQALENLAKKGNGTWISATSGDAFSSAFKQLDQAEMTVRKSGIIRHNEPFQFYFIAAGFFLLLAARFFRINVLGAFL